MGTQEIKTEIINNVLVAMSYYITQRDIMAALERVLQNEFVRVNMEEITTLPSVWQNESSKRNEYLIKLFIIKKRNLGRTTMAGYLAAVKRLVIALNNKPLDQVSTVDIEWYLSQYERRPGQRKERIEDTTYNNERRFLSAFYTWMRKSKLISENPVEVTEPKKIPLKPIDYYAPEDIIKMREACRNIRERAMLEVFRSTGARVGEIAAITLEQVDIENGDIWIRGEKGGKYRTLYLDDDARHYYKAYMDSRKDDSPYMFTQSHRPYGKMTTGSYRTIFKGIGKRAGLDCRVYPHKSRKTLGMNLKNRGVDIGIIQEVLGHANPAVTSQYYAQSTPKTLKSVRERLQV